MGDNGVHLWDWCGIGIIFLSCAGLLYLNAKWRKWMNKK